MLHFSTQSWNRPGNDTRFQDAALECRMMMTSRSLAWYRASGVPHQNWDRPCCGSAIRRLRRPRRIWMIGGFDARSRDAARERRMMPMSSSLAWYRGVPRRPSGVEQPKVVAKEQLVLPVRHAEQL